MCTVRVYYEAVVASDLSVFNLFPYFCLFIFSASATELCPADLNVEPPTSPQRFVFARWTLPLRANNIIVSQASDMSMSRFIEIGTSVPIQYTFLNTLNGETLVCGFIVSAIFGGSKYHNNYKHLSNILSLKRQTSKQNNLVVQRSIHLLDSRLSIALWCPMKVNMHL